MPEKILLDTNIVIEILNGKITPFYFESSGQIAISVITVMELYALAGMAKQEEEKIAMALLYFDIIPLDVAIAKRSGMLARTRRRGRPDLLIAATAIEYNLTLLTKNIRDFKNIAGLKVKKEI